MNKLKYFKLTQVDQIDRKYVVIEIMNILYLLLNIATVQFYLTKNDKST